MLTDDKVWEPAKDFQAGNVIVRVTKLVQHRPRYSLQIVRATDGGKVQRHFGVFMDFANGHATLRESIANKVAGLVAEAEAWVESEVQKRETELTESR